jgi:hypothetical protein
MIQVTYTTARAMTNWYNSTNSTGSNQIQLWFKGGSYSTYQSDWDAVCQTIVCSESISDYLLI